LHVPEQAGQPPAHTIIQTRQSDGAWEFSSSATEVLEAAQGLLASLRRRFPDAAHRMTQRTRAIAVAVLPECLSCRHWRCDGDGPCGALLDAWPRCAFPGPAAAAQHRVTAGKDFSRRPGPGNPETRDAWWSSLATIRPEAEPVAGDGSSAEEGE
jgi:hypothetical protein